MKKRCVIIGAAPCDRLCGKEQIAPSDFVLCADGGLQVALENGIRPDLTVGDFDSLSDLSLLKGIPHRRLPVEKDDTDTVAALRIAKELGYTEALLLNETGGRLDHTFANFSALFFALESGISATLTDGSTAVTAHSAERIPLKRLAGYRLSVFAFGEKATVSIRGVHYPLDAFELSPMFPLGISNEIESDDAELTVHAGHILMMTEKI